MIELEQTGFYRVAPLFAGLAPIISLHGIYDGHYKAQIFIDNYLSPKAALIWTPWGYHYLGGEPGEAFVSNVRTKLRQELMPLTGVTGDPSLLLTLAPAHTWKQVLPEILPRPKPIQIFRKTFAFNSEHFQAMRQKLRPIPAGYHLLPVNDLLIEELKSEIIPTWGSQDAYRERGFGFAVCNDERVVASCVAAFVSRHAVELGVHTHESYRRRGFGTHAAGAMIHECLRRNLRPNWECFWDNEPSVGLAGKLGFTAQSDYPIYYWAPDL